MDHKIKIHFVCKGNIFRSRVAEAYAKSLKNDEWEISSSGIDAEKYPLETLSPWAKVIGNQNGFNKWFSDTRMQTSNRPLKQSDIIIFMSSDVYQAALKDYNFNQAISLVWNIKDQEDWAKKIPIDQKRKRTFKHIKSRVQQLINDIEHGGWVDIVDENNVNQGFTLPISIANRKGLWKRCCHAVITTPDKRTLVQKRSSKIIFSPGLLDISLGGHIDAGETPDSAMMREIREEVGLLVDSSSLRLMEIHKISSYHPRYKRFSKNFTYSYHVPLAETRPILSIQKSEVSKALFLSPAKLHRLITYHKLKGLGRLSYAYDYYRRTVNLIYP